MAGLSDTLTNYRSKLAAAVGSPTFGAALTNLPEGIDIDDLPATKDHKVFRLSLSALGALGDTSGSASLVEYRGQMRLEVYWNPEVDTEAIWNTIGTDVENISTAMLKVSNRNAGTILVSPESLFSFEEHPQRVKGTATYAVRYRVLQDLS